MGNIMEKEKNIMKIVQSNSKVSIKIKSDIVARDMIKIKILFMK